MNFRRFSKGVDGIAPSWRGLVLTDRVWEVVPGAGGGKGESQVFFVRSGDLGGFAKPGKATPPITMHPRAAHEKIASDLAFDLGLPVPPAVLWTPPEGIAHAGRPLVISAQPFAPVYMWSQVQGTPSESLVKGWLGTVASAMCPFDTWVGNTDRESANNLLVAQDGSLDPPVTRAAYIDYANSLSHGWERPEDQTSWSPPNGWKQGSPVRCYPSGLPKDFGVMAAAIDMIEALPDQQIRNIVERIPEGFLKPARRTTILDGLLHRKATVRGTLKKVYPGKL